LNQVFFKELAIRKPDYGLNIKADTFGEQIGKILIQGEKVIRKEKPDRLLILGDTNSGLISIVAKRMGIPVYHMEAGNRCFDDRVPEEVNRKVIDHCSTILLPYTHRSKENLLKEGIPIERIYVTGNPIYEVLEAYSGNIQASIAIKDLGLEPKRYFLSTFHREENVDVKDRLLNILAAFDKIQKRYKMPVICSLHPRTKRRMKSFDRTLGNKNIHFLTPLGFFDFIALEQKALCVITDSGTVQEECCIFQVPNVTIRDVTERPETIEVGSNIITGIEPKKILLCIGIALSEKKDWKIPNDYQVKNVSSIVVKIISGLI
jgi:UDP-N-acetylglucosamine 2-epimerase (non-hydrolysing)